jgi:hypothetical protein
MKSRLPSPSGTANGFPNLRGVMYYLSAYEGSPYPGGPVVHEVGHLARRPCQGPPAYQDFLTFWKDADPDVPMLKQPKPEYAKLQ